MLSSRKKIKNSVAPLTDILNMSLSDPRHLILDCLTPKERNASSGVSLSFWQSVQAHSVVLELREKKSEEKVEKELKINLVKLVKKLALKLSEPEFASHTQEIKFVGRLTKITGSKTKLFPSKEKIAEIFSLTTSKLPSYEDKFLMFKVGLIFELICESLKIHITDIIKKFAGKILSPDEIPIDIVFCIKISNLVSQLAEQDIVKDWDQELIDLSYTFRKIIDLSLRETLIQFSTVAQKDERLKQVARYCELGANLNIFYDVQDGGRYPRTPLMCAVNLNEMELVQQLLLLGANPNEVSGWESALTVAIDNHFIDMAHLLLANGALPHVKKANAFCGAIDRNFPDMLPVLFNRGRAKDEVYLLSKAIKSESEKILRIICMHVSKDSINICVKREGPWFSTPIPISQLKILLESGLDPNIRGSCGSSCGVYSAQKTSMTLLMEAAYFLDLEKVKLLVGFGANVEDEDKEGEKAIDFASKAAGGLGISFFRKFSEKGKIFTLIQEILSHGSVEDELKPSSMSLS